MAGVPPEPFTLHVADDVLQDLRARLVAARWPDEPLGEPWSSGTSLAYLRGLVEYGAIGSTGVPRRRG
jgi:Epoxide hydrolase N terminus